MPEITDSGTSLTNKCSDTIEENILNTSVVGTAKPNSPGGKRTRPKPPVSDTSDFSERSKEPPPRFLFSELDQLTFKVGEARYNADDTEHTSLWIAFIADYADVTGSVDWEDLEERAHFLNMLYVHCEEQGIPFPLETIAPEKVTKKINAR